MVDTLETWNNDLSDNTEERELCDSDFEREAKEEHPHVYSPFSPFYNEPQLTLVELLDYFETNDFKP